MALRRTPIERAIDEAVRPNRRARWEDAKRAAGLVRITLRVHRDDQAALRTYAAVLLARRAKPAGDPT